MPRRSTTPLSKGAFYPPNDGATHRDLLLFEERLKSTAASLQQRKKRYQLFLAQLLIVIAFLLSEVLLENSLLTELYKRLLRWALPDIYGTGDIDVSLHPFFASGLLLVSVTTLVLFFASGMYSEKIGYANQYVPHANRALRSFNMYLNVRKPPLRSKLPRLNPLALFTSSTPQSPPPSPSSPRRRSPSPPRSRSRSSSVGEGTAKPIPPIPPAQNPRGELIFSSRVDRSFREAYERYRAAFERRREARERAARAGWGSMFGLLRRTSSSTPSTRHSSAGLEKGKVTPSGTPGIGTPSASRQGSPAPHGSVSRGRGGGSRSGTPSGSVARNSSLRRSETPPSFQASAPPPPPYKIAAPGQGDLW